MFGKQGGYQWPLFQERVSDTSDVRIKKGWIPVTFVLKKSRYQWRTWRCSAPDLSSHSMIFASEGHHIFQFRGAGATELRQETVICKTAAAAVDGAGAVDWGRGVGVWVRQQLGQGPGVVLVIECGLAGREGGCLTAGFTI
jgi:hypothetical protein